MPTATVLLLVDEFKQLPDSCTIKKPIIVKHAKHRLFYGSAAPDDLTLVAKGKGGASLDIEFIVPGYELDATPVNFNGVNTAKNFKKTQPVEDPSSVTITNLFNDVGQGAGRPKWKYSITIRDPKTGQSGVIDPPIENEQMD